MENSREYRVSLRRWQREQPTRPMRPVAYDAEAEERAKELTRREAVKRGLRRR